MNNVRREGVNRNLMLSESIYQSDRAINQYSRRSAAMREFPIGWQWAVWWNTDDCRLWFYLFSNVLIVVYVRGRWRWFWLKGPLDWRAATPRTTDRSLDTSRPRSLLTLRDVHLSYPPHYPLTTIFSEENSNFQISTFVFTIHLIPYFAK